MSLLACLLASFLIFTVSRRTLNQDEDKMKKRSKELESKKRGIQKYPP
jgi:hypothetical protein